jgi:hypothetical protein
MPFAIWIMTFVFALRDSALFLVSLLKSCIVWMKYETGRPATPAFLGTAFAVRVVTEAARTHVRTLALGYHLGHRGVIAGEPVGRTECVTDVGKRKTQRAAGQRQRFRIGRARCALLELHLPAAPAESHMPTRAARQRLEAHRR